MKKVRFITGLWGTGKSSIVEYLNTKSFSNYVFIDFDFGGGHIPPTDRTLHKEWRIRQTKYWLKYGYSITEENKTAIICGMSLYPSQLLELSQAKKFDPADIAFAHLTCSDTVRRKRLSQRGDEHIFEFKPWYNDWRSDLLKHNSYEIDTSSLTIEQVSAKVIKWLSDIN